MTHLGSQPASDEITEFYLQQSRKEGGGSYAAAYAVMRIMQLLRGDDDVGITTAVWAVEEAIREAKPES